MARNFFIPALFLLFIAACADHPSVTADNISVEVTRVSKPGESSAVATLFIEGMMCEQGCGTKIKKELSEIAGVLSADIQFEEERELNTAVVSYAPGAISEKELIEKVDGIADGKLYKVRRLEIVEYVPETSEAPEAGSSASPSILDPGAVFRFPNIFRFLRDFVVV